MIYAIRNIDEISFLEDRTKIGEVMITYKRSLEENIEIIKEYKDKRVVFLVDNFILNEYNIDEAKLLSETYKEIVFCAEDLETGKALREFEIPYFFGRGFVATTFDAIKQILDLGVTDIYIGGTLGFSLEKVSNLVKDVKIRVIPNIAQYSGIILDLGLDHVTPMTSFWIRPEDIEMYEGLIDVVEFFGNKTIQETFYSIYAIDGSFEGALNILISGMSAVNNKSLPSEFTESRLNCEKKCNFNRCHRCFKYESLAKLIDENNLEIESQ